MGKVEMLPMGNKAWLYSQLRNAGSSGLKLSSLGIPTNVTRLRSVMESSSFWVYGNTNKLSYKGSEGVWRTISDIAPSSKPKGSLTLVPFASSYTHGSTYMYMVYLGKWNSFTMEIGKCKGYPHWYQNQKSNVFLLYRNPCLRYNRTCHVTCLK